MLFLLDTDTSSYLIKGRHPQLASLRAKMLSLSASEVAISSLTRAELLYGLRRVPESRNLQVSAGVFLATIEVLDWPAQACEAYADIRDQLTTSGKLIGELDMLLAAHALALDATLVTNNTDHYRRIHLPLRMENWVQAEQ